MKVSKSASEIGVDKSQDEGDLDSEGFDLGLSNEYIAFSSESERAAKKMVARRKIELYWDKKRLQEQLGDFYDYDLDF